MLQSYPVHYDDIFLPQRATQHSAGYDFFAPFNFFLPPQEEILIPLSIKAYMQPNEVLMIYPRSGHGFKKYIRLANTVGVIDGDYYNNSKNEGHIWLKIRNESQKADNVWDNDKRTLYISGGEAICQGVFTLYLLADGDDNRDGNKEKRTGGFGSTNKD